MFLKALSGSFWHLIAPFKENSDHDPEATVMRASDKWNLTDFKRESVLV